MNKGCSACAKAITGNTYKVADSTYCRECFVCSSCKTKLAGTFLPAGEPHKYLCQACHKCTKCDKTIAPGDEHLVFGAARLHAKCLSCSHGNCGKNLSSKKLWKTNAGLPACEAHNGL